jgi:large subunit ribosomal protein L29
MPLTATEIREQSIPEIEARIAEEEQELSKLRFNHAVKGRLENPMLLRHKRRDIARLKTVLNEKKRAAATPDEA